MQTLNKPLIIVVEINARPLAKREKFQLPPFAGFDDRSVSSVTF
jgi:hypothetical protein